MTEAVQLWRADDPAEPCGPGWVHHRAPLDAEVAAARVEDCSRLCVVTGRGGAKLALGEVARAQRLPELGVLLVPSGASVAGLSESRADVCCLAFRASELDVTVESLRLGERRYRCALAPGVGTLVFVAAGAARLRVSGEELPLALGSGDACHAPGARRGLELDVQGASAGCRLFVFELAPLE